MSKQKPLSKISPPHEQALLIDRNQSRVILGVCYSKILRMEDAGKLTQIRLSDSPKAKVFHRRSQVLEIVGSSSANGPEASPPEGEPA